MLARAELQHFLLVFNKLLALNLKLFLVFWPRFSQFAVCLSRSVTLDAAPLQVWRETCRSGGSVSLTNCTCRVVSSTGLSVVKNDGKQKKNC